MLQLYRAAKRGGQRGKLSPRPQGQRARDGASRELGRL